jgi:hypothetical protein
VTKASAEAVGEFLTSEELRTLTQRARRGAQAKELDALGIPYLIQRGHVVVSRHHARERLEGNIVPAGGSGINWAAIR